MKKEIREANDDLVEIEFSGHHRWTIIKPTKNGITNPRHKFLDALARLFTETSDVLMQTKLCWTVFKYPKKDY